MYFLAAGNFFGNHLPFRCAFPFDVNGVNCLDVAVFIAFNLRGLHQVVPGIRSLHCDRLFLPESISRRLGHWGQGLLGSLDAGGWGMISS